MDACLRCGAALDATAGAATLVKCPGCGCDLVGPVEAKPRPKCR